MSYEYDVYLQKHKENVYQGFKWMQENIPNVLQLEPTPTSRCFEDLEWQIKINHDSSKTHMDEYNAYDAYFYGGNRSYEVVQKFNKAWNNHIHKNEHHWQHWVLINDDPGEGTITLEMPHNYIIEMICDWWSFSWSQDKLEEIFNWYHEHKDYIMLHPKTRKEVENILKTMAEKLLVEAMGEFMQSCMNEMDSYRIMNEVDSYRIADQEGEDDEVDSE